MTEQKQKLLIEYLLSSSDVFAICQSIVDPAYFDPSLRQTVTFIKDYYAQYNTVPSPEQIQAETGAELSLHEITPDQVEYTTREIEQFCKRKAIERAILASPALIEDGQYATVEKNIREAILISLHRNLGLRYFDTVSQRLEKMLEDNPVAPTGWSEVDELLYGGISRKELLLVSANSGGGKSITLSNLAFNFLKNRYNVLYISLELSEEVVAQRFDTMFTGISRREWKSRVSEITTRLAIERENVGTLDIIQMPSGTRAIDIRSYLSEYYLHYDMMPDLLILDYLDKMNPNETNIDLSDVWTKDKLCSEQLRDIGVEYNMFIATASQLNRSAVGASEHHHGQIAGGISKINESDVYWSIIMTDAMRAAGEIAFVLQKTRNSDGVGNTVYLKWDSKTLRITDPEEEGSLTFKKRETPDSSSIDNNASDSPQNSSLLDLMSGLS